MLSLLYVTQSFGELMSAAGLDRWVFFSLVTLFLLVGGCFLPPVALILVVMPLIQPSLEAYNFDMVWFGVIMTILMEIGLITPPVGVNLFVHPGHRARHSAAPDPAGLDALRHPDAAGDRAVRLRAGLITWLPALMLGG